MSLLPGAGMEQWVGKVAVVTGASSGIGSALSVELVKAGMIVVGLTKRKDKVEALRPEVVNAKGQLNVVECDITSELEVNAAYTWIEKTLGGIDLVINNAGFVSKFMLLDDNSLRDFRTMLETNIIGFLICTREALKMMRARDVPGIIVNINSIFGHKTNTCVAGTKPINGLYPACKFAVTAMVECLRQEIMYLGISARVLSISPGFVENDLLSVSSNPDLVKLMPKLSPKEVVRAVMFAICTPENVLIQDIIIKPEGEFI